MIPANPNRALRSNHAATNHPSEPLKLRRCGVNACICSSRHPPRIGIHHFDFRRETQDRSGNAGPLGKRRTGWEAQNRDLQQVSPNPFVKHDRIDWPRLWGFYTLLNRSHRETLPLQMISKKASTRSEPPHHVLVRSNPISVDFVLDVIERLDASISGDRPEVEEQHRFLDRVPMVDATNAFTGAFLQPVSLGNFSDDSDGDVGLVRYSEWLNTPSELAMEIEKSIDEVTQWISRGCSLWSTITYSVSDALFLGIERSNKSKHWKVFTHYFNQSIQRGEVSASTQKQRFDQLIQCLGIPFDQKEYRLEIVDGYLVYDGGPNARVTLRDIFFGIGDPRTHQRLEMQLLDDETPLLVQGLTSYFSQVAIAGRAVNRMGAYRENYEDWRSSFAHRDGFYEYLYVGVLADAVIAYLTDASSKPPVGFVPFANYRVTGPSRGSVTLSLEFSSDEARFWISGGESLAEEGMMHFLEATDLLQFTDESCVVFR